MNKIDVTKSLAENAGEVYSLILKLVRGQISSGRYEKLLTTTSDEDLASDYFLHFAEGGFYEKFDSRVSIEVYLKMGIRNYMIDRSKNSSVSKLSITLDEKIGDEDGSVSFKDLVVDKTHFAEEFQLAEILSRFSTVVTRSGSDRQIVEMLLEGFSRKEIASRFGVTEATVGNRISKIQSSYSFSDLVN